MPQTSDEGPSEMKVLEAVTAGWPGERVCPLTTYSPVESIVKVLVPS